MANFPTLSLGPDYPIDPDGELSDVVLRNETTGGYEITRPRTTRSRKMWGIRYSAMPDDDVATLRTFETTTLRNGADSFVWTHPITSVAYTVRLQGPIKYAATSYNINSVSFVIKQV